MTDTSHAQRISRIPALADTVFRNHGKAWLWLHSPEPRLGNKAPFRLLETEEGAKQVEALAEPP